MGHSPFIIEGRERKSVNNCVRLSREDSKTLNVGMKLSRAPNIVLINSPKNGSWNCLPVRM